MKMEMGRPDNKRPKDKVGSGEGFGNGISIPLISNGRIVTLKTALQRN
jgi:hypothetical protein